MGYAITTIHAGLKYKAITGLMKKYVEILLIIQTCNSRVKNGKECNQLNESHTALGSDIHITPVETAFSPGVKQKAKSCLNSLWGICVLVWIVLKILAKMIRKHLLRKYQIQDKNKGLGDS